MKNLFYLLFLILLSSNTIKNNRLNLRVMTFNIRYDNPADNLNNWKFRKENVIEVIHFQKVDILGAQEVLVNQLKDMKDKLQEYNAIGVGRDDGKEKGEFSPIFYKKDRFILIKSGYFWLSETPKKPSKGWDAACERIATWAQLKDISTGKEVFVLNTHFDHMGTIARRESVKLIKEKATLLSEGLPQIIMGDFNAEPESSAIKGMLNPVNSLTLFDSKSLAIKIQGSAWTFHDFGKIAVNERQIIDYIFVNKDISVLKYNVLSETSNGIFLSDHSPVMINVSL